MAKVMRKERHHSNRGQGEPTTAAAAVVLAAAVTCMLLAAAQPTLAADDPLAGLSERLDPMTPQEQIEYLQSYLEQGMTDARIHFFMGNAYYAIEQLDSAIAHFTTAVELDADYAKAYVNLGITYDAKGKTREARASYIRAIEINPNDVLAYCHLGFSYARHEPAKAVHYYLKALEIDPNSAQAHYNLGLAFAEAKIFNEALVEWHKVIELDPDGKLGEIATENVELIETYMELGN